MSEPQRLAMVLSTLFGDGRARLAGNNCDNFVAFQISFKFLLFLSYFVKPSREPIKQSITKVQARFCRILTTRFSEIRQQIWVTRELLNQSALKTVLLKKTNQYHTCCFGILHGMNYCHICPLGVHLAE